MIPEIALGKLFHLELEGYETKITFSITDLVEKLTFEGIKNEAAPRL